MPIPRFAPAALVVAVGVAGSLARAQTPATFSLAGRAVTETGEPIAGCRVTVTGHQATGYPLHWSWLEWRDPEPVETGADGRFAFVFPVMPTPGIGDGYPARVHVTLTAPRRLEVFGSREFSTFFAEPQQDAGDIELSPGRRARFRVVGDDGSPQPDVVLYVTPEQRAQQRDGWLHPRTSLYARSDDTGIVTDNPLAAGRYKIQLYERSDVPPRSIEIRARAPDEGEPSSDVVVPALPRTETISGRVADSDDKPVANYLLYAAGLSADGKEQWSRTRTGADGTFSLQPPIAVGAHGLRLRHPRGDRYDGWHEFGAVRPGDHDVRLPLVAPAKLLLLVRAGGQPVEDLAVHAVPVDSNVPGADAVRSTKRWRGGVVELDGLGATRYAVRVHARGGATWPSDWFECDACAAPTPVEVHLAPTIARTLHVFTAEGRPVAGCSVELIDGQSAELAAPPRPFYFVYHFTLIEEQPHSKFAAAQQPRLADRGITDASGKVVLRCRAGDHVLSVRVTGGDAQRAVVELPNWSDGRSALLVTVPGGGELRGTIAPPQFVVALDCSTDDERKKAREFGVAHDPWRRSLGDLLDSHRPAIALRKHTNAVQWDGGVASIDENGVFALAGAPPGDWDVVLVVRERNGNRVTERVIEPALGAVAIRAGETTTVAFSAPEQVTNR
ncbi:MAG: carboxypeptidase-like regulatory domain-containing protein [Planctomycetota bacterium]